MPYQVHDTVPAPGTSIHQFIGVSGAESTSCLSESIFLAVLDVEKKLPRVTPRSHVFRNPILDE